MSPEAKRQWNRENRKATSPEILQSRRSLGGRHEVSHGKQFQVLGAPTGLPETACFRCGDRGWCAHRVQW